MRELLAKLALISLAVLGASIWARAEPEETPPIQRYLVNLYLGDDLEDIQKVFPPAREWPATLERRAGVKRYRVDRTATKAPAANVDTMWLGLKRGRLVEVQLIYTTGYTRKKSIHELVKDLVLTYGRPRSNGSRFWWSDGGTVLRVFNAETPTLREGGAAVELRTSLQLMEAKLFKKED